jgi:Ethanolamine utilization protein EutJ (predicted chaperonin)
VFGSQFLDLLPHSKFEVKKVIVRLTNIDFESVHLFFLEVSLGTFCVVLVVVDNEGVFVLKKGDMLRNVHQGGVQAQTTTSKYQVSKATQDVFK